MTIKTNIKKHSHLIKIYPYGNTDKKPILFSVIIKDDYDLEILDGTAQHTENDCSLIDHDGIACAKTYKTINLAKRSLKKHLQTNFSGWEGSQFIIYGNSTIKRSKSATGAYILGVIYS